MNISIKDFRITFMLVVVYAFLYLIPFNRNLLKQFYHQFQNLAQKIYAPKAELIALLMTDIVAIVCLIFFIYYKSEQKRIVLGTIMGITIFPFVIWVNQQNSGGAMLYQEDYVKIWAQISAILLLYDFIRITKFKGGN